MSDFVRGGSFGFSRFGHRPYSLNIYTYGNSQEYRYTNYNGNQFNPFVNPYPPSGPTGDDDGPPVYVGGDNNVGGQSTKNVIQVNVAKASQPVLPRLPIQVTSTVFGGTTLAFLAPL